MKTLAAIILLMISIVMAGNVKQERVVDMKGNADQEDAELLEEKLLVINTQKYPACELGIARFDGRDYYPIFKSNYSIRDSQWSLDRRKIVFSYRGDYDAKLEGREDGIYVINSDGTNLKKVYSKFFKYGIIKNPSFSPDGKQIVFIENDEICTINIDGSDFKQLTHNGELKEGEKIIRFYKDYPSYSPDGNKIVFSGSECIYSLKENLIKEGDTNIFIMNLDDFEIRKIITFPHKRIVYPYWSLDSKKIAVGGDGVYIMNSDGTDLKKITKKKVSDVSGYNVICWLPDNQKIIYLYYVSTDWPFYLWENRTEFYIINADGTNGRMLGKIK